MHLSKQLIIAAVLGTSLCPGVSAQRRSADSPGGHVYATAMTGIGDNGYLGVLGQLDLTCGDINAVWRSGSVVNGEFYYLQDMALRDGIMYIPDFGQDMVTAEMSVVWKRFDFKTGQRLDDIVFDLADMAFCYALTYNPDKDRFYGLAVELATFTYGMLAEINPEDWSTRLIGNVGGRQGDFMASLAYNPADGELYGIKDNGVMYSVDAETAATYEVKMFEDYESYVIPEVESAQPMVYSPTDHCFVTVVPNNALQLHQLAYINVEDGSFDAYEGEPLPQGTFITGLICTDEYAVDNAPAMPAVSSFVFEGPSLDGSFVFTAPSTTFNGESLASDVTMVATVDGEEIWSISAAPGSTGAIDMTVAQGWHVFALRAVGADGAEGPAWVNEFYAGYDSPTPPLRVQLDGAILHWATPEGAAHGGYLDMAEITYDIYMEGVKQNDKPVYDNWYMLNIEGEQRRVPIEVVAVAHGVVSEPSETIHKVIGTAAELPVAYAPTAAQAELFSVTDANGDGNEFRYFEQNGKPYFGIGTAQYYEVPDDWFILPGIAFTDPDARYRLSFDCSNFYSAPGHYDDLEIYVGSLPAPQYMTDLIYSHVAQQNGEDVRIDVDFGVSEGGAWYIGFHSTASGKYNYRGVKMSAIEVAVDEAASALAPAAAADLVIEPAPLAGMSATARFTAPVTAINGSALDMDEPIEYTLLCGLNTASVTVMPGEAGEVTVDVAENGENKFYLTPSTASQGRGLAQLAKAYVGVDIPVAPGNVRHTVSDDNCRMTVTWDAPTEGQHGGHIVPEGISYKIYLYDGIQYKIYDTTTECSYEFVAPDEAQKSYQIAPVAVNEFGQSDAPGYAYELLGRPYELPMWESFNSASFDYSPWRHNTEGRYGSSPWSSVSNMNGLGIGDPALNMGAMSCMHLGEGPGEGELISPKVSTKGIPASLVRVRYWQYAHAAQMELWGRTSASTEYELLASENPGTAQQWKDWDVELPAPYKNCGWVQFRLRAKLSGDDDAYCLVDDFGVLANVENDFKVVSVTVPTAVSVGDDAVIGVRVMNSGLEMGSASLLVEILGDGKTLDSQTVAVGRTESLRSYDRNLTFGMAADYLRNGALEVRATVTCDGDEIPSNNSKTVPLMLNSNVLPIVADLKAEIQTASKSIALEWSEPDATYGALEDFEQMPGLQLTDKIGRWTNLDRDGQIVFGIEGLSWEGQLEPAGWIVFDSEALKVSGDPRLGARSGSKMVMARSVQFNYSVGEDPVPASDWLISPEIVGGTDVSFWFNTIDGDYAETIGIWVSKTDDNPDSFVMQQPFTKSGPDTWEHVTFRLPSDARYFAFEYRSIGQFGAMLDDIEMTPAQLSVWDIAGYRVYRTPQLTKEREFVTEVEGTVCEDKTVDIADDVVYHVATVVADAEGNRYEGPLGNAAYVKGASVQGVDSSLRIAGGRGHVYVVGAECGQVAVYTADGRMAAVAAVADGSAAVALEPGVYIVKVGQTVAKVRVL